MSGHDDKSSQAEKQAGGALLARAGSLRLCAGWGRQRDDFAVGAGLIDLTWMGGGSLPAQTCASGIALRSD